MRNMVVYCEVDNKGIGFGFNLVISTAEERAFFNIVYMVDTSEKEIQYKGKQFSTYGDMVDEMAFLAMKKFETVGVEADVTQLQTSLSEQVVEAISNSDIQTV